jgi:ferredoxin
MEKVLRKGDFTGFFKELKKDYKIMGAMKKGSTSAYAYLSFGYAEKPEDIVYDYHTTVLAPKKLFLPDGEALFGFKKEGERILIDDLAGKWEEKRALLGVHPCDITALSRLDKVFNEVYRDPYYRDRRRNTVIIGLTCNEAASSCFCNIVGSGPDLNDGYDLLMTDIGDSYFFKVRSEAGEKLVQKDYFRDATPEDRQKREAAIKGLEKQFKESFKIDGITQKMRGKYSDELWNEYSNRCVTCGICNMVCPTCHCFAVFDRANMDMTEGKRVRVWDSCHFERFARMAGGLDPREEKSSRFKHRLYDKFYYPRIRYGETFCVGCGRCIKFCQSEIDLRDALVKLQEG